MSEEARLVVQFGTLDSLQSLVQTAHDDIDTQVREVLERADAEMTQWDQSTASRAAQMAYKQKVLDGLDAFGAALLKVKTTLDAVGQDAHEAEVRNVAVLD